jgi:hypothetical protein
MQLAYSIIGQREFVYLVIIPENAVCEVYGAKKVTAQPVGK